MFWGILIRQSCKSPKLESMLNKEWKWNANTSIQTSCRRQGWLSAFCYTGTCYTRSPGLSRAVGPCCIQLCHIPYHYSSDLLYVLEGYSLCFSANTDSISTPPYLSPTAPPQPTSPTQKKRKKDGWLVGCGLTFSFSSSFFNYYFILPFNSLSLWRFSAQSRVL